MEGVVSLYDACGRSNERPYELDEVGIFNNMIDNHPLVRRLRTLERASLLWMMVGCGVGAKVGARPAQGAATTTDVDLRVVCG